MDPALLSQLNPPEDAEASLTLFRDRGLTDDLLADFACHTLLKDPGNPWRYFCGCAWSAIRKGWRPPKTTTGSAPVPNRPPCPNGVAGCDPTNTVGWTCDACMMADI